MSSSHCQNIDTEITSHMDCTTIVNTEVNYENFKQYFLAFLKQLLAPSVRNEVFFFSEQLNELKSKYKYLYIETVLPNQSDPKIIYNLDNSTGLVDCLHLILGGKWSYILPVISKLILIIKFISKDRVESAFAQIAPCVNIYTAKTDHQYLPQEIFQHLVKENANTKNIITVITGEKKLHIGVSGKGEPINVAKTTLPHIKNEQTALLEKNPFLEFSAHTSKPISVGREDYFIEDWINERIIDLKNTEERACLLRWLEDFQIVNSKKLIWSLENQKDFYKQLDISNPYVQSVTKAQEQVLESLSCNSIRLYMAPIHRDFVPKNILYGEPGKIYLLDSELWAENGCCLYDPCVLFITVAAGEPKESSVVKLSQTLEALSKVNSATSLCNEICMTYDISEHFFLCFCILVACDKLNASIREERNDVAQIWESYLKSLLQHVYT